MITESVFVTLIIMFIVAFRYVAVRMKITVGQMAARVSCPKKYPVSPDVPEISLGDRQRHYLQFQVWYLLHVLS